MHTTRRKALDRVRAEIKSDTDSLPQSDVSLSSGCCNCPSPALPPCEPHLTDRQLTKKATTFRKASDFTAAGSLEHLPSQGGLGIKLSSVVGTTLTKLRPKKPHI
ncbi:hypothetical protein L798_02063 [Zootermopsis nevadensis]|uniref:Uncharacterized protein n=1 Tax=Zootermopsis nevadensis TaxID=136037 RepID=A0A067RNC5_ZOONE|nr:hypothetical protein L798_02063 [Zootermopsis nevadensis]